MSNFPQMLTCQLKKRRINILIIVIHPQRRWEWVKDMKTYCMTSSSKKRGGIQTHNVPPALLICPLIEIRMGRERGSRRAESDPGGRGGRGLHCTNNFAVGFRGYVIVREAFRYRLTHYVSFISL